MLFLAGCASERSAKQPEAKPGFFESPDRDSLN